MAQAPAEGGGGGGGGGGGEEEGCRTMAVGPAVAVCGGLSHICSARASLRDNRQRQYDWVAFSLDGTCTEAWIRWPESEGVGGVRCGATARLSRSSSAPSIDSFVAVVLFG